MIFSRDCFFFINQLIISFFFLRGRRKFLAAFIELSTYYTVLVMYVN